MIQTKTQFSLSNAKRYFREHLCTGDYYSEGQQVKGEWFGVGAEKLGFNGAVRESDFLALCEGQHPETGRRLGQRINTVRREAGRLAANRRIFFDFTIAPPKSVSVVALYQDERIVALHNRAVRSAMAELETFAATRVRKSGANGDRSTGNVIGVSFRHETSRELDPHLHTHCVVFNVTFDATEERWKALETAAMYRAQSFAANLYRHELCRGLRSLGYEIENHARGFEIKGVPASVVALFSKRHRQIDDETAAKLAKGALVGNVKELRERIAHGNRRRKLKDSTAERLRPGWAAEIQPAERAALANLRPTTGRPQNQADVAAIVTWAEEHLFERRAVVNEHELMAAALERGRGHDFALADLRRETAARASCHR
jgi:conjugative relaxase-like TrwC/TraI family protein